MRIICICCTYKRPVELANMIACFDAQDYKDKKLIIIDDAGQYSKTVNGNDWQLISYDRRFKTIGEKRNESARLAEAYNPSILSVWDDDDIYLPWHLSSIAKAMEGTSSCVAIPSEVWFEQRNRPLELYTGNERWFHGAWAFHRSLFDSVGGYTEMQSGQDQDLLEKFREQECVQVDPIQSDPRPSYIYRFDAVTGGYNLSSKGINDQNHFEELGKRKAEFQEVLVPRFERNWLAEVEGAMQRVVTENPIDRLGRSETYEESSHRLRQRLSDRELKVSDQAALFIVDEEGLLFSAARGEIYQLNSAATFVWCGLEDGASWDDLVSGLSTFCEMTPADAEITLESLVVQWRGQGVLRGNEVDAEEVELAPSRDDVREVVDEGAIPFPTDATVQLEQHYRVLETCFCVQFCEREHVDWLVPALTHFEVSGHAVSDHVITVYGEGDKHHIFRDRKLVHTDMLVSQLAPFLKYQLIRNALDRYDHILNLHAGAVSKDGALIAMPAESGGGKSTLVAGLIKRGYQYFSDELAPLARNSCEVVPVPLGMCIKDTAFSTLQGRYPEIIEQPIHDRTDGRRAIYLPPPKEAIAASDQTRKISHLVFPRYQAGATTVLKPVPRVEAFARVMEQCVSIPKPLTLEDAVALVHWIEQVQCYDLMSGSLEAAMDQIDGLVYRN